MQVNYNSFPYIVKSFLIIYKQFNRYLSFKDFEKELASQLFLGDIRQFSEEAGMFYLDLQNYLSMRLSFLNRILGVN